MRDARRGIRSGEVDAREQFGLDEGLARNKEFKVSDRRGKLTYPQLLNQAVQVLFFKPRR